jgi:hypothetical protein
MIISTVNKVASMIELHEIYEYIVCKGLNSIIWLIINNILLMIIYELVVYDSAKFLLT